MSTSFETQSHHDGDQAELAERHSLRRVIGMRTELEDISEVEYRQLRLERVVLISVWTSGTQEDADNAMAELKMLAETAGSEVLEALVQRRSQPDPATYIGLWDDIRALYASTPESKARGYAPGRFSFNVSGGRCEACKGDGQIKIEMHFLPDIYVPCEVCGGARYNRETLQVTYRGKNVYDVLEMTVDEALGFFKNIPALARKLQTMHDVGLGYIRLGQPATTLSGGEAQRVKLASELQRRQTGKTIYILDEPTTGLHMEDVRQLLEVLQRLVDSGNTVLVIEHNLDVIKSADRIVDLGPDGGDRGGTIVAAGTPEEVAQVAGSHTGAFLQRIFATQGA